MNIHVKMISTVADALGDELLREVAFVGGCATGLLITDEFTKEQVRHTDDVDLIVHVLGNVGMIRLQNQLGTLGFRLDMTNDDPICAMRLGELRVDFMPDDVAILGFTNKWYSVALLSANDVRLPNGKCIRLVAPEYFIATKIEAYLSRGNNDPLASRDVEDILTLIDGRPELMDEIAGASQELRAYISDQITSLIGSSQFSYAVTSAAGNDAGREELIFKRLQSLIQGITG